MLLVTLYFGSQPQNFNLKVTRQVQPQNSEFSYSHQIALICDGDWNVTGVSFILNQTIVNSPSWTETKIALSRQVVGNFTYIKMDDESYFFRGENVVFPSTSMSALMLNIFLVFLAVVGGFLILRELKRWSGGDEE